MGIFDLFNKKNNTEVVLNKQISAKHHSFWTKFSKIIVGKSKVDNDLLDKLEALLISSDVGISTTFKIIDAIEKRVAKDKYCNLEELNTIFQEEIENILQTIAQHNNSTITLSGHPHVILVVGVNGVGKTTTIGKLAAQFILQGKKVILGAADTFRAAAVDQLSCWGNKIGAQVITKDLQSDPASVAYEAVKAGIDHHADVVIIDTAGRLHTKTHLIQELSKIKRTIQKSLPNAPEEVLLILDGTTGQNAYTQAEVFTEAVQVTGIIITKLDSTSKGGVILGIADQFAIPIKYIGTGEKVEDLMPFNAHTFIKTLFSQW